MKIAQNIVHDDKTYNYGDDVSAEDAKNLPDGYAVSDSEFDKLEEEGTKPSEAKPVEEMTDEEIANHPSQAPTAPPAEPVIEDGALVSPQPVPEVESPKAQQQSQRPGTDKK